MRKKKVLRIYDQLFGIPVTKQEFDIMTGTLRRLGIEKIIDVNGYILLTKDEVFNFISNMAKDDKYGPITGHFIHESNLIVSSTSFIEDVTPESFKLSNPKVVVSLKKMITAKLRMALDLSISLMLIYDKYQTFLKFFSK